MPSTNPTKPISSHAHLQAAARSQKELQAALQQHAQTSFAAVENALQTAIQHLLPLRRNLTDAETLLHNSSSQAQSAITETVRAVMQRVEHVSLDQLVAHNSSSMHPPKHRTSARIAKKTATRKVKHPK